MDDTYYLELLINGVSRIITNRYNYELKKRGVNLTYEQWELLCYINQNDGQTQQDISNKTFRDKTTTTRILEKLLHKSLILKVAGKFDKRNRQIFLTQKGLKLLSENNDINNKIKSQLNRKLKRNNQLNCIKSLEKILLNLE